MDDLIACHVVGWRRIPPNRVGGKLCPCIFMCNILKRYYINTKDKEKQWMMNTNLISHFLYSILYSTNYNSPRIFFISLKNNQDLKWKQIKHNLTCVIF